MDHIHSQVRQNGQFELKMKFIEYIDTAIERLYLLDNKKPYNSEVVRRKYEEYYHAEDNQREQTRIDHEKTALSQRLKELGEKERVLEVEALKIELENGRILKDRIHQEYTSKELEMKGYIHDLEKKIKAQEKEIERIAKVNAAQGRELEIIKEERNRAEKREVEWREKYEAEVGLLETFDNKKNKYLFRNDDGLKIVRTFTNVTTDKKGCQRLVLCDLPLRFHVVKIVYGIKVGLLHPGKEVEYFHELSLYEKEDMVLSNSGDGLMLEYVKRKVKVPLDKYRAPKNQVIIMLFGKGDSVGLDETE